MEYRELGQTGISVSVIGFGAWQIGGPPFWSGQDENASAKSIHAALEAGITLFDTAPVYGFGTSEKIIGPALKSVREKVVIATKCGLKWNGDEMRNIYRDLSPKSVRAEAEDSLRRLGTDYIDLYQIHWPPQEGPVEPALEEMAKLKEEQKIRAIGVSNFDANLLKKAMTVTRIDSIQPKYNLLEREAEEELLPLCVENGIGVLAYSPLASGLLTGKYDSSTVFNDWRGKGNFGIFGKEALEEAYKKIDRLKKSSSELGSPLAHIAINWVIANRAVTSALVGIKKPEEVSGNIECLERPLSEEEKEIVERA